MKRKCRSQNYVLQYVECTSAKALQTLDLDKERTFLKSNESCIIIISSLSSQFTIYIGSVTEWLRALFRWRT